MNTKLGNLYSLGHVCQIAGDTYEVVRLAVGAVQGEPAVTLNGVPYFNEATVQAALRWLREHDAKKDSRQR